MTPALWVHGKTGTEGKTKSVTTLTEEIGYIRRGKVTGGVKNDRSGDGGVL